MDGSEHSNEEQYQTTEFSVENYCDASFDDTHHKKLRLSSIADYNIQPIPEGINIWWYSSEANIFLSGSKPKRLFLCTTPNLYVGQISCHT